MHAVGPHVLRDGARAQQQQEGGAFMFVQRARLLKAVKLLHSEGRASGPLRRRSAVLEKSSEVGMMAMESAGLAAHSDCETFGHQLKLLP